MSQETVERILGRIVTDQRFRRRLFARREEALESFELTEPERESLKNIDPDTVELLVSLLAKRLDPRILRA